MKKLLLVLGLSVALSAPSVVSAEATWYGSLRAGVEFHDGDSNFKNVGSRWGIKGSNEISDGLTAVYRFEHGISTADASQPQSGGRLAYAGLSGGFGTITAGQIWSASYNSVGAITDNSNLYGDSETSARHGNVVSYANTFGPASVQLDLVMDGAKDTGKDIDQVEFGLSVALGDIGKIAIAHVKKEDLPATMTNTVAVYKHTIGTGNSAKIHYTPKAWVTTLTGADATSWYTGTIKPTTVMTIAVEMADVIIAKNSMYTFMRTDQGYFDNTATGVNTTINVHHIEGCAPDVNAKDACVKSEKVYVTPFRIAAHPTTTTVVQTYSYFSEDLIMKMNPGSKANHIAAEFSFGGVTPYLGYSEKKMNGKTKKDKTTFVGVRGSVGDTGFGYLFQYRDKEKADGTKLEPWVLGLSKTMGGGASLNFEHGDPGEKGKKSKTAIWLKVDF